MEIAFEKVTLDNGLDVIFHQERSLPVVAVNVWYHVGSKDEEPGKTGFAHLFEHIMFEGTKHHPSSHFEPLQKVGALLNGSTTTDRTNYWENVPSNYLRLALWLESERMGFLLDALDQRRFDIQRDVVKNERRQSYENRPYGMASLKLQELAYPTPHPYHWPTIGHHEDLDNADLDDVRAFFRRFYVPNNASLAIAGDFDLEDARDLVAGYFADIPPGLAVPRTGLMPSPLQGPVDATIYDRVMLPRLYLTWPTVARFHSDEAPLSVLAAILGDGRSSRLHRSLVYEKRIAQSVSVHHGVAEVAGLFHLDIITAPGHTPQEVEEAAHAEVTSMREQAPEADEVQRAKNHLERQAVGQLAHIGGFGGRANRLNSFNIFAGDPGLLDRDLDRYLEVRPEDVQRVAQQYLGGRRVRLNVLPEPPRNSTSTSVDRTVEPGPGEARDFVPPAPQRRRLGNGLNVLVLEKRDVPLVAFGLSIKSGAINDPEDRPGLSAFATGMLQEGTVSSSSQEIAAEFEFLGAQLAANTGREEVFLATETLAKHWPRALELVSDVVQNPTFPEQEMERLRTERLTALGRMKDDASLVASRVAPMLVYGSTSPYGHSMLGTEASLEDISRDDLLRQFGRNFSPEKATLIVVGDVSVESVVELAERCLGNWSASGGSATIGSPGGASGPAETTLYLVDKPGAAQSVLRAAHPTVPRDHPDYYTLAVFNYVLGGQFTARLNMNLRQDKGYSYGFQSYLEWHRPSSMLLAGGGVQTEVTREAIQETLKEFRDIQGPRPVEEAEYRNAKEALLRQLPSQFEVPSQILEQLARVVLFDLSDDYHQSLGTNIENVTLEEVRRVAGERLDSDRLAMLVVGDRARIEQGLRELGIPLVIVDADGRELDRV